MTMTFNDFKDIFEYTNFKISEPEFSDSTVQWEGSASTSDYMNQDSKKNVSIIFCLDEKKYDSGHQYYETGPSLFECEDDYNEPNSYSNAGSSDAQEDKKGLGVQVISALLDKVNLLPEDEPYEYFSISFPDLNHSYRDTIESDGFPKHVVQAIIFEINNANSQVKFSGLKYDSVTSEVYLQLEIPLNEKGQLCEEQLMRLILAATMTIDYFFDGMEGQARTLK